MERNEIKEANRKAMPGFLLLVPQILFALHVARNLQGLYGYPGRPLFLS